MSIILYHKINIQKSNSGEVANAGSKFLLQVTAENNDNISVDITKRHRFTSRFSVVWYENITMLYKQIFGCEDKSNLGKKFNINCSLFFHKAV